MHKTSTFIQVLARSELFHALTIACLEFRNLFYSLPGTIQMKIFTISGFHEFQFAQEWSERHTYHVSVSLQTLYWVNNKHCLVWNWSLLLTHSMPGIEFLAKKLQAHFMELIVLNIDARFLQARASDDRYNLRVSESI